MAYSKTFWEDRIVEYPNRYKDQHNNTLILTQDAGIITAEGTPVNAERMNNIENGIYNNDLNKADKKKSVITILNSTNWSNTAPYTQNITVNDILATDVVNVYPIYSDNIETRASERENYAKISLVEVTDVNTVKFTCDEEKPEINLNIRVEVVY